MDNLTSAINSAPTSHTIFHNVTSNISMTSSSHVTTDLQTTELIQPTSVSTAIPPNDIPTVWGYVTVLIAVLMYGSNIVPVKQFKTGDGVFFQWVTSSGTMLVGIVVQLVRESPPFFPLAMTGGLAFALGNMTVVPIVKTVGLGVGFSIWAMICLLSGWSTGRFGFFGIHASAPSNEVMNYIGVGLCLVSAVIFSLVKSEMKPAKDDDESKPLLTKITVKEYGNMLNEPNLSSANQGTEFQIDEEQDESFLDRMSPRTQRAFGLFLCIFSGLMYGQMFTGATYIQDHPEDFPGASQNGLDYAFADFCGIFVSSTAFFIAYIIIMKNKPKIYPRVILPGMISGIMWGIGTTCWFVANRVLSLPVAFPMVSAGPPIVASMWGIIVFKEIRGRRNLMISMLGFSVTIAGAVLAGVSKD